MTLSMNYDGHRLSIAVESEERAGYGVGWCKKCFISSSGANLACQSDVRASKVSQGPTILPE